MVQHAKLVQPDAPHHMRTTCYSCSQSSIWQRRPSCRMDLACIRFHDKPCLPPERHVEVVVGVGLANSHLKCKQPLLLYLVRQTLTLLSRAWTYSVGHKVRPPARALAHLEFSPNKQTMRYMLGRLGSLMEATTTRHMSYPSSPTEDWCSDSNDH